MDENEIRDILTRLEVNQARMETKLDLHLVDHQKKFDLFTKAIIPGTSIIVSVVTALVTHLFGYHHH